MNAKNVMAISLLLGALQGACKNEVGDRVEPNPSSVADPPSGAGKPATLHRGPPAELGRVMPSHPGPTKPPPTLWLQPGDLVTSTGETPIRAWLDNQGAPVDPKLLSAIASVLELREYPSMKLVAVDKTEYNPPVVTTPSDNVPTTQASTDERAYVGLQPKAPLAKSWHVLSLSSVPTGVQLAPWSAPTPPVGAYAARFHVDSHPILTRVLICKKDQGVHRVVYEFSENVQSPSGTKIDALAKVNQPSTGKDCNLVDSGPTPASSMRWIDQSCDNFVETAPWGINLMPGLVSPAGMPLRTFDGATAVQRTLDLTALPDVDNGCKAWRP